MDVKTNSENSRRDFLGQCGSALQALLLAGAVAPLIQACEMSQVIDPPDDNSRRIEIDVASLTTDGSFLVSTQRGPDGKTILVVRKSATEYLSMSMECSHLQCEVGTPVNGIIACPCHHSLYDLDGNVVRSPAVAPLKRYANSFDAARTIVVVTV